MLFLRCIPCCLLLPGGGVWGVLHVDLLLCSKASWLAAETLQQGVPLSFYHVVNRCALMFRLKRRVLRTGTHSWAFSFLTYASDMPISLATARFERPGNALSVRLIISSLVALLALRSWLYSSIGRTPSSRLLASL